MLNLTPYVGTLEQVNAGLVEPVDKDTVRKVFTFTNRPSPMEILGRVSQLVSIAVKSGEKGAIIDGSRYIVGPLELALRDAGVKPFFAHTSPERSVSASGVVTTVFRFKGFYEGAGEATPPKIATCRDREGGHVVIALRDPDSFAEFGYHDSPDLAKKVMDALRLRGIPSIPTKEYLQDRVNTAVAAITKVEPTVVSVCLAEVCCPAFLAPLEVALAKQGIDMTLPFYERRSADKVVTSFDGTTRAAKILAFLPTGIVDSPVRLLAKYLCNRRVEEVPAYFRTARHYKQDQNLADRETNIDHSLG